MREKGHKLYVWLTDSAEEVVDTCPAVQAETTGKKGSSCKGCATVAEAKEILKAKIKEIESKNRNEFDNTSQISSSASHDYVDANNFYGNGSISREHSSSFSDACLFPGNIDGLNL